MSRSLLCGLFLTMLIAVDLAADNFTVAPAALNFQTVKAGSRKALTFKITAPKAMDFEVSSSEASFTVDGDSSFRADAETTITVQFSPSEAGSKEGKITIRAPGEGVAKTVTVRGVGN